MGNGGVVVSWYGTESEAMGVAVLACAALNSTGKGTVVEAGKEGHHNSHGTRQGQISFTRLSSLCCKSTQGFQSSEADIPLARSKRAKGAGLDCGVVARGMVVWSVVVWGLGVPRSLALRRVCRRPYCRLFVWAHFLHYPSCLLCVMWRR